MVTSLLISSEKIKLKILQYLIIMIKLYKCVYVICNIVQITLKIIVNIVKYEKTVVILLKNIKILNEVRISLIKYYSEIV